MLEEMKSTIKMVRPLYRAINRIRGFRLNEPALQRQVSVIGSDYGAWGVDLSLLHPNSIVYSIGVGEDITFDAALIEAVGCNVYAFDPTPIAVDWIARQSIPKEFHFHPIGLSSLDGEAEFQVPPYRGWHSFWLKAPAQMNDGSIGLSAESGAELTGSARLPVRRLSTLMNQFGHDHLDLIKLDIEGFEYAALDDMIATSVRPTMLLVEFHHGFYGIRAEKTRCAVSRLIEYEYGIFWVSDVGREYGFLDLHALRN
jgi:FkbM family methyltransferase